MGVSARSGGALGGDGGFVETSSKNTLNLSGRVDASAPKGRGGQWLLDPNNVTINATADANVAGAPNYTTTNDSAVVTVASIQGALNAGTSVTIATGTAGANTQAGDITVSSAISKTAGGDAALTLQAANSIFINGGITSTSGELDLTLRADADTDGVLGGAVAVTNATIDTNGGDLVIGGANAALPAVGTAANDDGVTLTGSAIATGDGNISIRGRGEAAGASNYGVHITGTTLDTNAGNITITGTGGNGVNANYGVFLTGAGTRVTSVDGAIGITGIGGDGSSSTNYGVYQLGGAVISSTGTGAGAATITIDGTGGAGTTGNEGVICREPARW